MFWGRFSFCFNWSHIIMDFGVTFGFGFNKREHTGKKNVHLFSNIKVYRKKIKQGSDNKKYFHIPLNVEYCINGARRDERKIKWKEDVSRKTKLLYKISVSVRKTRKYQKNGPELFVYACHIVQCHTWHSTPLNRANTHWLFSVWSDPPGGKLIHHRHRLVDDPICLKRNYFFCWFEFFLGIKIL